MNRFFAITISSMLVIFLFAIPVLANEKLSSKSVLINYLDLLIEQNVEEIIDYVIDERVNSLEETRDLYEEIMTYEKLIDYQILEGKVKNENSHYYIIKTTFENGMVTKTPIQMKKIRAEWKVFIDFYSLENEDYEILVDEPQEEVVNNDTEIVRPLDVLCIWNFWDRAAGSSFYSNCTFSVPNTTSMILGIDSQGVSSTPAPTGIGINYSIVRQGVFGDTEWGTRTINGTISSGGNYTITGNTSTFTNAKIRFRPNAHDWGGVFYYGKGGLDW